MWLVGPGLLCTYVCVSVCIENSKYHNFPIDARLTLWLTVMVSLFTNSTVLSVAVSAESEEAPGSTCLHCSSLCSEDWAIIFLPFPQGFWSCHLLRLLMCACLNAKHGQRRHRWCPANVCLINKWMSECKWRRVAGIRSSISWSLSWICDIGL